MLQRAPPTSRAVLALAMFAAASARPSTLAFVVRRSTAAGGAPPLVLTSARQRRWSALSRGVLEGAPHWSPDPFNERSEYKGVASGRQIYGPSKSLSRMRAHGNGDGSDSEASKDDFEPSWTYKPYIPSPGPARKPRRNFSSGPNGWNVPKSVTVPIDRVEISFVRSSGAGGQNVNKVNTKVELRFHLSSATWIPAEVRDRIARNEPNRISKDGYIGVTSQEYRTQAQNRKDAMRKVEEIILRNYPRPKVRKLRKGPSKKQKRINKENKKKQSDKKANRRRVDF